MRASLAIVLAGGVPGAMLLAMFFVPAAYCLLLGRRASPGRMTYASRLTAKGVNI